MSVDAAVTLSPEGKTAVLDPTNDLQPGGIYEATLTSGVSDMAGNTLAPYSFTFTVVKK